jgi:hypothetical protein
MQGALDRADSGDSMVEFTVSILHDTQKWISRHGFNCQRDNGEVEGIEGEEAIIAQKIYFITD